MSKPEALPLPSGASTKRLPSLDGLRGVAILFVVLAHVVTRFPSHGWWNSDVQLVLEGSGHIGVSIFFVLSGYLITYLLRKEVQKTGTIDLPGFYWRRILRIFPAFYTYLGVIFLLVASGLLVISAGDFLLAGTYTWNYRPLSSPWNPSARLDAFDPRTWYLGHIWTLSIEEQFYLFWPALLLWGGLRAGPKIAAGIFICEPFLRVATYFLLPSVRTYFNFMLPWALDPLFAGAFAALCAGEPWFEAWLKKHLRVPLAVVAVVFLAFITNPLNARLKGFYGLGFEPTLDSLAILTVVLWALRNPATFIGQFLNSRPMVAVGVLSYSLYLWQQLFLVPWTTGLWWVQRFPQNLACCFAAAMLSHFLIEKPFLRLKDEPRARPTPLPVVAASQVLPSSTADLEQT